MIKFLCGYIPLFLAVVAFTYFWHKSEQAIQQIRKEHDKPDSL